MHNPMERRSLIQCKLTLILEPQPEGGFTITCQRIPELITECDSLDDVKEVVTDTLYAVLGLYASQKRPLPEGVMISDSDVDVTDRLLLETVVQLIV